MSEEYTPDTERVAEGNSWWEGETDVEALRDAIRDNEEDIRRLQREIQQQDADVDRAQMLIELLSPILTVSGAPSTIPQVSASYRVAVSRVLELRTKSGKPQLTGKARDTLLQSIDLLDDVIAGRGGYEFR
jgi:hypothetical protein